MISEALIKEAGKAGFYLKRTQVGDRMEPRWTSKCICCGTERTWNWGPNYATVSQIKGAEQVGWSHDKRGLTCNECVEKEQKARRKMSKIENIPNPKIQRDVYRLLDDYFDEETRLYRNGWTDKKIAAEAKTSEQFVVTLRRGAYGELAEDPALTALRIEMAELEKVAKVIEDDLLNRMAEISDKITKLHERINSYELKRVA